LQRPSSALLASALYLLLVLCGLISLRRSETLSTFTAFLLMGVAGFLSSLPLLRITGLWPLCPGPITPPGWTAVFKENWIYGRWLVGSTVLYSVSSQVQTLLVAWLLGLGAAGVLRAMQLPMLMMAQVVTAVAVLELPRFSYEFGRGNISGLRRKGVLVTAFLTGLAGIYDLFLFAAAALSERTLFGGRFSTYAWLIPILGLIPVCTGFGAGCSIALRSVQRPQFDLVANGLAALVGSVSAILFIRLWGVAGAAASMVLSFAVLAAVTVYFYKIWMPAALAPRISQ
ncbi:MAG: oligosaccharide flippase family protein, partial [Acidobacteriota bacterium]